MSTHLYLKMYISLIKSTYMGLIARFSELDRDYSRKIAFFLPHDSKLRTILQLLTLTGTAFFWSILIPIWYIAYNGGQEAVTLGFITGLMLIPVFALKQAIRRPRPDYKDTRLGAVILDKWSFPSGHATRSTYVLIIMTNYFPELMLLWLVWAMVMISSRLLLGVHYISDILTGIILSIICISLLFLINWLPTIPFEIDDFV